MSEFLHRARVDNLRQRYPYATEDQITHALTVENGHAGRAGMLLAQLSPEKNDGSADPFEFRSQMVGLHGVACAERRTSLTFAQAKRSPPKSQMSGAVHLLAAKALHEYAERHKDDPIEGVTLPCDMPPRSPAVGQGRAMPRARKGTRPICTRCGAGGQRSCCVPLIWTGRCSRPRDSTQWAVTAAAATLVRRWSQPNIKILLRSQLILTPAC